MPIVRFTSPLSSVGELHHCPRSPVLRKTPSPILVQRDLVPLSLPLCEHGDSDTASSLDAPTRLCEAASGAGSNDGEHKHRHEAGSPILLAALDMLVSVGHGGAQAPAPAVAQRGVSAADYDRPRSISWPLRPPHHPHLQALDHVNLGGSHTMLFKQLRRQTPSRYLGY